MSEQKFYNLTPGERLELVARQADLTPEEARVLSGISGLSIAQAEHMIENVVGVYSLPIGIAGNFVVNGREVPVPMVIEEPSVVAGASFMARLAQAGGGFHAEADAPVMIGQMQVLDLPDVQAAKTALEASKARLLQLAEGIDPVLQSLAAVRVTLRCASLKKALLVHSSCFTCSTMCVMRWAPTRSTLRWNAWLPWLKKSAAAGCCCGSFQPG